MNAITSVRLSEALQMSRKIKDYLWFLTESLWKL